MLQIIENDEILVARKQCFDLYDVLKPISFHVQNTEIVIKPRGYTYSMGNDCFIGISAIDDSLHQIRLGTVFLRNFYTGLDFDKNMIMLGVNAQNNDSEVSIIGKSANPYGGQKGSGKVGAVFAIVSLALMFLVGCGYGIIQSRKNKANYEAKKTEEKKQQLVKKENPTIQDESMESSIEETSTHYLSVAEPLDDVTLEKQ